MPFAVSKYQDTYTERTKPAPGSRDAEWQLNRFDWFDSEDEARAFLQDRAFRAVERAEKELKRAKANLAKCRKKFTVTFAANSGESK